MIMMRTKEQISTFDNDKFHIHLYKCYELIKVGRFFYDIHYYR